ncbi:MAG: radical SAM protein [Acidimicrobiales bacterium]|jgi:hypothetical protein
MRVLLLSTYELGHQPLGIAAPAAALEAAGHETRGVDLSMSELAGDSLDWAEAVAISIPMHTATRLGLEAIAAVRSVRPDLPVAWHGLYAPVLADNDLVRPRDLLVAGEAIPALLAWLRSTESERTGSVGAQETGAARVLIELGPARPARSGLRPLRRDLPPLEGYARLKVGGREITTASVAASTGCNHRCRHCPVAPIYQGRSRPVDATSVMDDIAQVVEAGAGHVSFADPDFLNRPAHALDVAGRLHAEFPALTFDATVKVEHIIRHPDVWPELRRAGLLFVVSAFESVDDAVLQRLDKGHVVADEAVALDRVRSAGIELRPSWLPFTPWTTLDSVASLLQFVAEQDLIWSTDPVQYSIRLLLPSGSLLLDEPDDTLLRSLGAVVDGNTEWASMSPGIDDLQVSIANCAEAAGDDPPDVAFAAIWELARTAGVPLPPTPPPPSVRPWLPGPERPRLTESWFCCAEPTGAQLQRLRVPS